MKHLAPLSRQDSISGWFDRMIRPGEEWGEKIDKHLNDANIIILLISSDFIASDFCYCNELKTAMERHETNQARVLPVVVRDVDWSGLPFAKLQMLPKDAKAISTWEDEDSALKDVAIGVRKTVDQLLKALPEDHSSVVIQRECGTNLKLRITLDIEYENLNGEMEKQVILELSRFARQVVTDYDKFRGSVILEFKLDTVAALRLNHAINQGRFLDLNIVSSLIIEQHEMTRTDSELVIVEMVPFFPPISSENQESRYEQQKRSKLARRPVILINADFRAAQSETPSFSFLRSDYYDCIFKAGAVPLIVPPCYDESRLEDLLEQVDGVLMTGGEDLDPRRDGYMLHSSVRPMNPRREDFDRLLAMLIARKRMPVFGIGVGMQLLNVVCGGSLFFDITIDLPNAFPHRDPHDPMYRHSLVVTPDSLIGRVLGQGEIRVNSRHHMAIDKVASIFRVTAKCQDGVIEAIESASPEWFALGTQFHPEVDSASASSGLMIFEKFVDGVSIHSARRKNEERVREA